MTPDIRKERETALYEAALRLIAKGVNPAAMKVQQIADEAGIGKGTVYEYFASRMRSCGNGFFTALSRFTLPY